MFGVGPAGADSPGCSVDNHCCSHIQATGTTTYGMYGSWNRASMGATNSYPNSRFVTSEMWACNADVSAWVEVGHEGDARCRVLVDPRAVCRR